MRNGSCNSLSKASGGDQKEWLLHKQGRVGTFEALLEFLESFTLSCMYLIPTKGV